MDVKRVRYFDGLFLKADEFNLDQNYHVRMRRLHNRHLHTWGIVRGLTVIPGPGARQVTVEEGMALNRVTVDGEEVSQEILLTADRPVDLSGYAPGDIVYISIAYAENEVDVVPDKGGTEEIHRQEDAAIGHGKTKPPTPNENLILARVTLKPDGTVDASSIAYDEGGAPLRTFAGAVARQLELTGLTMTPPLPSIFLVGNTTANRDGLRIHYNETAALRTGVIDVKGRSFRIRGEAAATGAGGTERLYVDLATGNVGIGTTTPPQQLSITGGIGFANVNATDKRLYSPVDGLLEWMTNDTAAEHGFAVSHQGTRRVVFRSLGDSFVNGGNLAVGAAAVANPEGWDRVLDLVGASHARLSVRTSAIDARVLAHNTGWWGAPAGMMIGTASGHSLSLATSGATRLSIDAGGNVGISGNVSFGAQTRQMLSLWGTQYALGIQANTLYFRTDNQFCWFRGGVHSDAQSNAGGGVLVMALNAANDLSVFGNAFKPGGGAWAVLSDIRLKHHVAPLTGALDRLLALRGVTFEWREPARHGNLHGRQIGLVAQEVEAVFPEWVGVDAEGYKHVTVRGLEALTVEALRELTIQIDDIRRRLDGIETMVSRPV